jgi:hypothetical protein
MTPLLDVRQREYLKPLEDSGVQHSKFGIIGIKANYESYLLSDLILL